MLRLARGMTYKRSCGGGHWAFTMLTMTYQNIITIESGKRGGKPCIRGMRITVYDVLEYLVASMTTEEILANFPY